MRLRLPRWLTRSPVAPDPDEPADARTDKPAEARADARADKPAEARADARADEPTEARGREAPKAPDAEEQVDGKVNPAVPPVVVPRWVQLVVLPLALLGLWELARKSGSVLLILIVASLVALIFNPIVERAQRRLRLRRGLAIAVIYLGTLAIIGGIGVLLANPISNQVTKFADNVPHIVKQANHDLDKVQRFFNNHGIHIHIEKQGQTALQTLQKDVLKRSGDIVSFSRDLLGKLATTAFDLVLVLVLSIYLLVYGRQIGELVRRIMPPGDGGPEDDFPTLVQRALSGYVRGQIGFSLIMGGSAALGLWVFSLVGIFSQGGQYAIFFGAFYGLMEFIPYIGPIIGPVPAVLVALFNNPLTALWVVLMFVALQQLEGHVVAPQVFRISLRINPILIILSLLIGYQLYGIAGALVALPAAAVIRQTVVYLRRHLVLEPWDVRAPPGTSGEPLAGVLALGPNRLADRGDGPGSDDEPPVSGPQDG